MTAVWGGRYNRVSYSACQSQHIDWQLTATIAQNKEAYTLALLQNLESMLSGHSSQSPMPIGPSFVSFPSSMRALPMSQHSIPKCKVDIVLLLLQLQFPFPVQLIFVLECDISISRNPQGICIGIGIGIGINEEEFCDIFHDRLW